MIAVVTAVNEWSQTRKLKLNAQKSEVIWLGTRQQLAKLSQADMTLQLPDDTLIARSVVRNLGVQLDTALNFDAQARNCVKTCYYHLRHIKQIKRYVDQDCMRSLVHAFITSRLDYCNSLFAQCNVSTIHSPAAATSPEPGCPSRPQRSATDTISTVTPTTTLATR